MARLGPDSERVGVGGGKRHSREKARNEASVRRGK